MHPLRIIILALLLYLLFRLLFGKRKRVPRREEGGRNSVQPSHDVLVEDPVCHTYIPKGQAIVYKSRDEIHYFCSEKCRQTFVSEKGDTR